MNNTERLEQVRKDINLLKEEDERLKTAIEEGKEQFESGDVVTTGDGWFRFCWPENGRLKAFLLNKEGDNKPESALFMFADQLLPSYRKVGVISDFINKRIIK